MEDEFTLTDVVRLAEVLISIGEQLERVVAGQAVNVDVVRAAVDDAKKLVSDYYLSLIGRDL